MNYDFQIDTCAVTQVDIVMLRYAICYAETCIG